MIEDTLREQWIDEVFASSLLSAEVKLFLLFLGRYCMDEQGHICEKRAELAERLGCHPRKVSAKFEAAVKAQLLRQTARGQKGQNSAYQAVVTTVQGASTRHPEPRRQGADDWHAETAQGAADCHPENSAQGAADWHAETVQGASTRHPEDRAPYEDHARARPDGDRSSPAPAPARDEPDVSFPDEPNRESVSRSSRQREAHRWLLDRYRLTDEQAAEVYQAAADRAATPMHTPVRYLAAMAEKGHLADIVAAVTAASGTEESAPPALPALSVVISTTGCDRHPQGAIDPVAPEGWGSCLLCNTDRRRATARGIPADAQPPLTLLPPARRPSSGRDRPDAPYQPSLLLQAAADPGPDTGTATRAADGSLTFPAADTGSATG